MIIQKITGQPQRACSLPCPHCRAGADGKDLGLFWDFYEDAWRCIFCGLVLRRWIPTILCRYDLGLAALDRLIMVRFLFFWDIGGRAPRL